MFSDEIERRKWKTAQRKGRLLIQPVSVRPRQETHTAPVPRARPARPPARPLLYVQHASLNFNIPPAMFSPFPRRHVDSAGQIKKAILRKMHTKCGDASARSEQGRGICPSSWQPPTLKAACSWQQLCSGLGTLVNAEY